MFSRALAAPFKVAAYMIGAEQDHPISGWCYLFPFADRYKLTPLRSKAGTNQLFGIRHAVMQQIYISNTGMVSWWHIVAEVAFGVHLMKLAILAACPFIAPIRIRVKEIVMHKVCILITSSFVGESLYWVK